MLYANAYKFVDVGASVFSEYCLVSCAYVVKGFISTGQPVVEIMLNEVVLLVALHCIKPHGVRKLVDAEIDIVIVKFIAPQKALPA